MAFGTDNNLVMPVSPMAGNTGFGGWGDDAWLILIILFAFGGFGGLGNGFGGGGLYPWMNQAGLTQNGFNQASTTSQLGDIQTSLMSGFSNAEVSGCNRAMDSMQTAYNNQIASMNQNFANQQALDSRLFSMEMAQQNCCCENKASIADLKYTVATEACADRTAVNDALRDVLTASNANTQKIIDMMCQDKIDAKNEKIAELQTQINMQNLATSQTAQTAALIADNNAQTQYIVNRVAPYPVPSYNVPNPYGFGYGYNNFGYVS